MFLVADDSWSESTVTHATRPDSGAEVGGFDLHRLTPGDPFELDVTRAGRSDAARDGVLSLYFQTIDGRFGDLKYFASKEYDPAQAFSLAIETAAVPLPPAVASGAIGLALAWWTRGRRT